MPGTKGQGAVGALLLGLRLPLIGKSLGDAIDLGLSGPGARPSSTAAMKKVARVSIGIILSSL